MNKGEFQNDYYCKFFNNQFLQLVKEYPDYEVWVTGHSLGGALAVLTAMNLRKNDIVSATNMKLITFGEPRVGNYHFADRVRDDDWVPYSYRVTHKHDPIPRFPVCALGKLHECSTATRSDVSFYQHGVEIYYSEDSFDDTSSYKTCTGDPKDEDKHCIMHSDTQTFDDHKTYFDGPDYC